MKKHTHCIVLILIAFLIRVPDLFAVTWYPVPLPPNPLPTKVLLPASRDVNAPGGLPARKLFDYGTRDPYILNAPDGYYYMVATAAANSLPAPLKSDPKSNFWEINDGIPLWRSTDLIHWETMGYVWTFEHDATWADFYLERDGVPNRAIWAPEITYMNGTYWICYSHNWDGTGVLKSTTGKPEGPYVDIKEDGPLTPVIDNSLFKDDDGKIYIMEAGYKIARMKDDMTGLAEPLRKMNFIPSPPWGEGINMQKIDGIYVWSNAGNTMFQWDGSEQRSYDCFSATSDNIYGPYTNRYRAIPYAGHNNFFKEKGTGQWYSTLFHSSPGFAWDMKPGIVPINIDKKGIVSYKRSYPHPKWAYTTTRPGENWTGLTYNDSSWITAPGAFGDPAIEQVGPLTDVGTEWLDSSIWLRKTFNLNQLAMSPFLFIRHTGPVEVFINGQSVYKNNSYLQDYITHQIPAKVLVKGDNIIAIVTHKNDHLNYIDAGLIDKEERIIHPTAFDEMTTWQYTTATPESNWMTEEYDARNWKTGQSGFGTKGTPNAKIGTVWDSSDIWLRREFNLDRAVTGELCLKINHDENAEIYINGQKVLTLNGFTTMYVDKPLPGSVNSALRVGKNTIAIHCNQTGGGQYIDMGLTEVSGKTSESTVSESYTNPVGKEPIFMGDPFAFFHDGTYYLIGTTDPAMGFECYSSPNMMDWQYKGYAWKKTDDCWAIGAFWAPEVEYYKGKFYMTYSGLVKDTDPGQLRMALAVSDRPEGPYHDVKAPWFDPGYSTIDGHIFVDDDERVYLYFSHNGAKDGYSYGMNYGVELSKDLLSPIGKPVKLIEASQPWERINWDKNRCNEGAFVLKHQGKYYMTYSANHTEWPGYGVGYATADKPLGPWTKAEENPILKSHLDIGVSSPGHNSIVQSPDGSELFIVYHTHGDPKQPSAERVVNIDRLTFTDDGKMKVLGPTRSNQPLPSGTAQTFTWQNPLPFTYEALGETRKEIRDPAIIREGDRYYLTFTVWPFRNREENLLDQPHQGGSPGIKLYSSSDLTHWQFETWLVKNDELPENCPYKNRFWAPEIHKINGKFYLIFTSDNWIKKEYNPAGSWGSAGYAFIGVADKITGPYEHITYIPGGACDTSLFGDKDGKTYAIIPAYDVFIQEIDLTQLEQNKVALVGPRKLAVKCKNDDIKLKAVADYQEGPWMIYQNGKYILMYSGPYRKTKNPPEKQGYWAGFAYADTIMGPWTKDPRGQVFYGGHMTIFDGPDNRQWLSYRWESDNRHRGLLCVDPIDFDKHGHVITTGPTDTKHTVILDK